MPDRDYNILFNAATAAQAATDIERLVKALRDLDAIATQVAPKIKSLATGASTAINNTTKSSDALAASLGKTNASASQTAAILNKIQGQSIGTGQQLRALGGHSD